MSKQHIKSSNEAPSLGLGTIVLYALAIKAFDLPVWCYGVVGTIGVLGILNFIYRMSTEEGVDVVKRNE